MPIPVQLISIQGSFPLLLLCPSVQANERTVEKLSRLPLGKSGSSGWDKKDNRDDEWHWLWLTSGGIVIRREQKANEGLDRIVLCSILRSLPLFLSLQHYCFCLFSVLSSGNPPAPPVVSVLCQSIHVTNGPSKLFCQPQWDSQRECNLFP